MRAMLFAAAILGVASVAATEASAQIYPYCAYFNRMGGENCGFTSFAQCRAYISGIGGFCGQNPWYAYAAASPFTPLPFEAYPIRKQKYRR